MNRQIGWSNESNLLYEILQRIQRLASSLMSMYGLKQVTGLTLLSTGWTLVGSYYEYDLTDANITANSSVMVIIDNDSYDVAIAAEILPETVSSAGSVKIFAKAAPTDDIDVTINIEKIV